MATGIRYARLLEDNPLTLADHVKMRSGATSADLTQAALSGGSIKYRVFEYANQADAEADSNGTEILTESTLTISAVVFDTLQSNDLWTDNGGDSDDGFNLLVDIPAARFPSAGKWYRIEIKISPPTGDPFKIVWVASTTAVASS